MTSRSSKRITKTVVDALQPGQIAWDGEIKGFGCRCQMQGKIYVLKYRMDGRQRWYTIGRHGSPWTPETARSEALKRVGDIEDKKDPAAQRDREKVAPTVEALSKRFMTEHVGPKRKGRTKDEYQRLFNKIIVPHLGTRKAADITRADIAKFHHAMEATPYQANRVLAVLSKLFNLAEVWGERPDNSNPCRHVEKYQERKHERFLSGEELQRLGTALVQAEKAWKEREAQLKAREAAGKPVPRRASPGEEKASYVSPHAAAAVRLLVFTGARLSEILTLEWSWIDFERGEARLPDSKTGVKTLHLPPPALAVLSGLEREEKNPFVIVGQNAGTHLVNLEKPWRRIRKAAKLEDVRLHDLRHGFASIAASSGMGLPIIGKMLGHTQAQTTARYAHLAADPVKNAVHKVAAHIEAAMGQQASMSEAR